MDEGNKTLPFGHYKIDHCRVEDFSWDLENYAYPLLDSIPNWDHYNSFVVPDKTISKSPEEWETPETGFAMTSIINEDVTDSDDIVDLDATTSSSSSSPNPFIKYEANERSKSGSDYEEPAIKVARRQ